jgi:hypothetical protein
LERKNALKNEGIIVHHPLPLLKGGEWDPAERMNRASIRNLKEITN